MDSVLLFTCIKRSRHLVSLKEILFCKATGKYCTLHTESKKIVVGQSFGTTAVKLPVQHFIRIHRSYLVALKKIKQFTDRYILVGNEKIPLSRRRRKELLKLFSL